MEFLAILYVLSLLLATSNAVLGNTTFDVLKYGAVGNGKADDTSAFVKAFDDACHSKETPTLLIPAGKTFFVRPLYFKGQCSSPTFNVLLEGTLIAPDTLAAWKGLNVSAWISFTYVKGLHITGGGLLDGRGQVWWDHSCKYHADKKDCILIGTAPTMLDIRFCDGLLTSGINFTRSGGISMNVYGSNNVDIGSLNIENPGYSPNTDGLHISHCTQVSVHNSIFHSGDDCISLVDESFNVNISQIYCGPGHGISIGSVGGDDNAVIKVQNITIQHIHFFNTTNGARIKTKEGGKGGLVAHLEFSDIIFDKVNNPIIIDQHYGGTSTPGEKGNIVHIDQILYYNLRGTSNTQVAINLNCSAKVPCTGITLDTIDLESATPGHKVISSCSNAHGISKGTVIPGSCLLH